jgi:tetratricopeptide (TPR) repeat protein
MKKIILPFFCIALLGCSEQDSATQILLQPLADCASNERCLYQGDRLLAEREWERAIPYFKQAIRFDASPPTETFPAIRWEGWGGPGMLAMQGYCIALRMLEDYRGALDCFHVLTMDGTGIYIGEINEILESRGEVYPIEERKQNEADFLTRLVYEVWGM